MSNLSNLLNSDGLSVAESTDYEYVPESAIEALLTVAMEDVALEEGLTNFTQEENSVLFEGVLPDDLAVLEASVVKLDRNAKKQRAYKLAILQCAREDNNKDYKKLETLWKMEKYLFRRLEKRYASKARSRMNKASKRASAKTGPIKKLKSTLGGNKLTRSQKETQKALKGNNKTPAALKAQTNTISQKLSKHLK